MNADNKLFLGSFAGSALGLFFILIGQIVSFNVLGSFGIWIAIVNIAYLAYVAWAIKNGSIDNYKNILIMVHTYCLSGITFTSTLGLSVGGFGYMTLVGSILALVGDGILCFLLFGEDSSNLSMAFGNPNKKQQSNPRPVMEPASGRANNRDTVMTDYSEYSADGKRGTINYSGTPSVGTAVRDSAMSASQGYVEDEKEAISKYDYAGNPDDSTELVFKKGAKLYVVPTNKNWWEASDSQGNRGIVPANYMLLK